MIKGTITRQESLRRFAEALLKAMTHMPAGYYGAGDDRDRFIKPIEVVIVDLQQESR